MVKISVVVPTHGRIDLFKETLNSLIKRTSRDFEVIITDDSNKTDEQNEIKTLVKQAKKENLNIKYIFTKANLGQAKNTNQGLENTNGEYIRILHSDDLLAPNCIEKELEVIKEHPNIDFFNHQHIEFQNTVDFNSNVSFVETEIYNTWLTLRIFEATTIPSTLIFKRKLYEKLGGLNDNLDFLCDWEFYFKLLLDAYKRGKTTGIISKGLVGWRMHENSTSGSMALIHFKEHKKFIRKINKIYKKLHILDKEQLNRALKAAKDYRYKRLLQDYNKYKNFKLPYIPLEYTSNNAKWFNEKKHLEKHINYFINPIKTFCNWAIEPFSILNYAIKFLLITFKELYNRKYE